MIHWHVTLVSSSEIVATAMKTFLACTISTATVPAWCSVAKTNKCKCATARAIWCRIRRNQCTATWRAWNVWIPITNHCRWWLHRGRPARKASFATVCHRARKSISPLSMTYATSKQTKSRTISHIISSQSSLQHLWSSSSDFNGQDWTVGAA